MYRFILLAVIAATLFLCTAQAQTPPAPPPSTEKPREPAKPDVKKEVIEVKAEGEYDARKDDTATKIIVNSAEIMKYGDTQVLDVLKRLPGLTVAGNAVRMRGLSQGYTQILVDGERPPPGFTLDNLSPALIERIEIVRAATAEFSTQSIGGTLNIVLKKKVNFAQRDLRFAYSHGQFSRSPNASFVISDKAGDVGYTVAGGINTSRFRGEFRSEEVAVDAAGNSTLLRQAFNTSSGDFNSFNFSPRLVWTLGGGDSLNVQGFIGTNRNKGTGEFSYLRADGIVAPVNSNQSSYGNHGYYMRAEAHLIKRLESGAKLDAKLIVNDSNFSNESRVRGFNTAGQQNLDRSTENESTDRGFVLNGKLSRTLGDGHSFVSGWDFNRALRNQSNFQNDVAIPNVFPAVQAFNADERFESTVDKTAFFVQDEWNVTKLWSVYLGLRWEGIRTTAEGSGFNSSKSRSSVWSPIMQTLYKLQSRPGEQIRLALTRTYKAPSTGQLVPRRFSSIENRPTSPDFTGNPDLQPELATGIDLAYEKFWGQGGSVSVSGSMRHITDYNRRGLRFIDGRWVSLPVNDGEANTRSLQFETKFPVQSLWKEAPPVDFRFNMNKNWSTVDSVPGPNNRLDQQTPFSASIGLDYRMRGGMVTAGGSFGFVQGGEARISANQIIFQTARRDLEAYALWKITPKVQTRLTLNNILTRDSHDVTYYFDENGSTYRRNLTPSKMSLRFNLELKL